MNEDAHHTSLSVHKWQLHGHFTMAKCRAWVCLATASCLGGWGISESGLPAAWMIGPMLGAIAFALLWRGSNTTIPPLLFQTAQGIVGTVIASSVQPSNLSTLASHWGLVSLVGFGTLAISIAVGLLLSIVAKIERVTSILGALPGGASGMVAMSESVSADTKLVAVMQYVRLMVVVLSAAVGARLIANHPGTSVGHMPTPHMINANSWWGCGLTIAITMAGMWGGRRLRLPAGALLGPLILGILCSAFGIVHIQLPSGIPSLAYAVIGVYVGLLFDKPAIKHAGMLLPYIFASTIVLIAGCAGLGWILMRLSAADFATCFLGTSPGGIDSIAMTALGSGADMSLVVALQTVRMLVIVLVGPAIVRLVSHYSRNREVDENIGRTPR